jgi:fucose permease
MSNSLQKKGLFTLDNGQKVMFTFMLVSSLFFLWGMLNGMIDVMDKHFQDELGLSKSQSAWVQFAHYLGYFAMALPAGWIASKLGYKGGIIAGLLMVAAGGFWFMPATTINAWAGEHSHGVTATMAFLGYLAGVFAIAAGLTFLETVANPYTTVLGPREYAATRINLAQSCNGIGWLSGPIIGGLFFYAKDASGHSIGSEMIYIPYVTIACGVLILAVIFFFAYMPDVKTKDDYHIEEKDENSNAKATIERKLNRGLIYLFLVLNMGVLVCVSGILLYLPLSVMPIGKALLPAATLIPIGSLMRVTPDNSLAVVISEVAIVVLAISTLALIPVTRKVTHHSIWSHPHFSGSVFAQFLYVAAQAGIFSFFINYMTTEVPELSKSLEVQESKAQIEQSYEKGEIGWFKYKFTSKAKDWFEIDTKFYQDDIKDLPKFAQRLKANADPSLIEADPATLPKLAERIKKTPDPVSAYLYECFSDAAKKELHAYEGGESRTLKSMLVQELNLIVRQDPRKAKDGLAFYNPQVIGQTNLEPEVKGKLDQKLAEDAEIAKIAEAEKNMTKEQKLESAQKRAEMEKKVEKVDSPMLNRKLLQDAYPSELGYRTNILCVSDQGAAFLFTVGFTCFFIGRFSGASILKRISAHKMLGLYGLMNVAMCILIFLKLGWFSVICVFFSFFFMSIMFPTIFALGIFGLGARAKKASAFLVMAIMGGAVLPKVMGAVADHYDMSRSFIVPLSCFIFISLYGFLWSKLSGAKSLSGLDTSGGH